MKAEIEDKQLVIKDKSIVKKDKCLVIYPESEYEAYLLAEWKNKLKIDCSNVKFLIEKEIKDGTEILNWAEI